MRYILIIVAFIVFAVLGWLIALPFTRKGKGGKSELPILKATKEKEEAAQELLKYLNEKFYHTGREIAAYDGIDTADGSGWVFFWDTVAFIQSKDPSLGFKGSNPIYYEKETGRIRFITQAEALKLTGKAKETEDIY